MATPQGDGSIVLTTKVVYTMDEGLTLEGGVSYYGAGSVMDVNGDNKLAIKSKADAYAYFQLPSAWSSKPYYKATKISFNYSTNNTTDVKALKKIYFAGTVDGVFAPTGTYYTVANDLKYFNGTISFGVTEDMYSYKFITGPLYAGNWEEATPRWVYIDNVTIYYEYDFDYVEPVEPTTYDITVDGEVVATVEEGAEYTLPELPAGKYYVDVENTTFVVTGDMAFTTATYTYDVTIDGVVVATVAYGETFVLPTLEAGKYYVDADATEYVVTGALAFTTATYTYDVTIDGVVVATVAYGETFTLPAVAEGMQYVDGYVAGQEFVVTEALSFATEEIPEQDGPTTDLVETQQGASIRLNEVNGMRFYATFNGNLDEVDEMGIIIAPQNIVGDYFTMEDDHIKVVYDHKNNELWADNTFVGSIVNVADRNLARDFIARAYVVVDGVTYYAADTTVRNLAGIADAYIADADGGYAELDADTQAMVDAWAKAND